MPYIKSHSNYVLKKRHQDVNGGTVYERDITTIGGRNNFSKGQVPLYQSGNFVITINNEDNVQKSIYSDGWEQNDNGEIWTLGSLDGLIKDETGSEDEKIVLKQDYYNLRDFAYFGSCSELIRASISDILKKYPGELFVPYDDTVIYTYTYDETQMVLNDDDTTSTKTMNGLTAETNDYDEVEANNGYNVRSMTVGGIPVFYYDNGGFNGGSEEALNDDGNGNSKIRIKRLGGDSKFLVDNPFNIDIHTSHLKDSEVSKDNFLKFFANGGYENYEAIDFTGNAHNFTWSVNNFILGLDENGNEIYAGNTVFSTDPNESQIVSPDGGTFIVPTLVTSSSEDDGRHHYCLGREVVEITISVDNSDVFVIEGWVGDGNKIYYLLDLEKYSSLIVNMEDGTGTSVFKYSLRPKTEFINDFMKNLDSFEKILMNAETTPKFTATFNVIRENEFGYYTNLERFIFPTTYGGYNIGSAGPAYDDYLGSLVDIATFYDERFCDNMYRSMTHESIKNFDWTYLRHRTDEDEEDIKQSGDKIAKVIRLFGRQFDEILAYVDNIKNYNVVTYDNINNLPDYFFTDILDEDGWDVKQIIPYTLFEYVGDSKFSDDVSEKTSEDDEKSNSFEGKALHRLFTTDTSFTVKPYASKLDAYANGYFFGCLCDLNEIVFDKRFDFVEKNNVIDNDTTTLNINVTSSYAESGIKKSSKYQYFDSELYDEQSSPIVPTSYITSKDGEEITGDTYVDCIGVLRTRIKNYSSENDWTMPSVNNEFMKRLILNSKNIWRHKGTQEGVEMILGMFGMKSKRWYDALPEYEKDTYKDNFKELGGVRAYDYEIKEYTSFAKRIEDPYVGSLGEYKYDWVNQSKNISYETDEYVPYQGIPVTYRDTDDGKRYIYPNFQKNATYDGNPYYQMNGGWLSVAPYLFDKDNNLVLKKKNGKIYNETLRNIRSVNNLQDLFEIPLQNLNDGDIVHVSNLTGEFAVVDGRVYPLEVEYNGSDVYRYFKIDVLNGSAIIGNAYFNNYVMVSDPYSIDSKRRYGLADGESDGLSIKVYLINRENISGESIYAYSDEASVSTFTVFENGKYMDGDGFTNYFRINDTLYSNELSILGWEQLKTNDYDYYRVNSEKDYFHGNNPHTGHLHYDNGHEYFTYFRHLFRYTYNNSLFNDGVLSEYPKFGQENLYDDIDDFGFRGLINDDSCQLDYEDFLTEDSKIHYFGDYYNENGNYEYSLDEELEKWEYNLSTINPITIGVEPVNGNSVGYGWMYKPCGDNTVEGNTPVDGVTNQIVNNKVVKVIFYIRDNNFYSKTAIEEIKYLESVVVPYMTQMMPSGVILGTDYRFVGQGVHSYTIKTVVKGEPIDGLGVEAFNDKTNEWELVGYTEQGVLTFEKEGDLDKINVRITGGDSEEATLDLNTYYVGTDFNQTPFNIDVTTSYKKINFVTTEGEVSADGCLEFNGESTTNSSGNYFTYEIVYKDGDGWIEDDVERYTETLTESGGTMYLGTSVNNTLFDREATIVVRYNPSDSVSAESEVQIHQYANTEEVTYTVISNVNDGIKVYFYNVETNELEFETEFKYGVAEYTKPKVSANNLNVKIEGGLPSSSVTYTLDTEDGSREEVLSNVAIANWSPNLVYRKSFVRYTWDDEADLNKRVYKDSITFLISPDETIEKNYSVMKAEMAPLSEVTCLLQNPSVSWVTVASGYKSNISANSFNVDRSTVLRYYLKESESTFIDYKITQSEGQYFFEFNSSNVNVVKPVDSTNKKATSTTDYTKHTLTIPTTCITSYATTVDNKIGFIAVTNDSDIACRVDGNYIYVDLNKNTCTKSNSYTITFIQKRSNKRIVLSITQTQVICSVGDVYCYNSSNGNYYFKDVLNGDAFETNTRPIGITIIPMDNGLTDGTSSFARIISLTEKNSEEYKDALWRKSDSSNVTQGTDYRWRIGSIENSGQTWVAALGTEPYNNTTVMEYKKGHTNGLYYAVTSDHVDKIMRKDAIGHYRVSPTFANDTHVSKWNWASCLCDFKGFQKTRDACKQLRNVGAMYEMCNEYETTGTNRGEWFVGGAGEMGCLVQNIGLINAVIDKLIALNYDVTRFHYDYHPSSVSFKKDKDNGSCYVDYYWCITNKGRVDDNDDEESGDPNDGEEYSSWLVLLSNGSIQWAVHRAGSDESAARNQVRARVRPMLLVDAQNKHITI